MARPTSPPNAAAAVIGRIFGARMDSGKLGAGLGVREEFDKDTVLVAGAGLRPPAVWAPSTQERRRYAGAWSPVNFP